MLKTVWNFNPEFTPIFIPETTLTPIETIPQENRRFEYELSPQVLEVIKQINRIIINYYTQNKAKIQPGTVLVCGATEKSKIGFPTFHETFNDFVPSWVRQMSSTLSFSKGTLFPADTYWTYEWVAKNVIIFIYFPKSKQIIYKFDPSKPSYQLDWDAWTEVLKFLNLFSINDLMLVNKEMRNLIHERPPKIFKEFNFSSVCAQRDLRVIKFARFSKIETLRVDGTHSEKFTDSTLNQIPYSHLKEAIFDQISDISADAWIQFIQKCPHLSKLSIFFKKLALDPYEKSPDLNLYGHVFESIQSNSKISEFSLQFVGYESHLPQLKMPAQLKFDQKSHLSVLNFKNLILAWNFPLPSSIVELSVLELKFPNNDIFSWISQQNLPNLKKLTCGMLSGHGIQNPLPLFEFCSKNPKLNRICISVGNSTEISFLPKNLEIQLFFFDLDKKKEISNKFPQMKFPGRFLNHNSLSNFIDN